VRRDWFGGYAALTWGEALPRRRHYSWNGLRPSFGLWGRARTRGAAPISLLERTARQSLASRQGGEAAGKRLLAAGSALLWNLLGGSRRSSAARRLYRLSPYLPRSRRGTPRYAEL